MHEDELRLQMFKSMDKVIQEIIGSTFQQLQELDNKFSFLTRRRSQNVWILSSVSDDIDKAEFI